MKTIQIDNEVYQALANHVQGFNETPNDVIARILKQWDQLKKSSASISTVEKHTNAESASDISNLLSSPDFQRSDAIERYFAILAFLYRKSPKDFGKLEFYRRKGGRRVNFSKDKQVIENSGNSTQPKRIPGTLFYALTNLDNKSKRLILGDIMPVFGYSTKDIRMTQKELPDSGISRPKRFF